MKPDARNFCANSDESRLRAAFSLIEMIGVLFIITVLAAILLPVAIKRIDLRVYQQEVADLSTISNALTQAVLRTKVIPEYSRWTDAATNYCPLSIAQITANPRRQNRIYYRQSGVTLPYTQDTAGLPAHPQNYRAIAVSVLGGASLNPGVNCPDPSSISTTDFDHLWTLADDARPTLNLWNNWSGRRDDLLIQRIDYAPLFHQLILVNRDTVNAGYAIDDSSVQTLTPTPGVGGNFLDGTIVGLWTPASGGIITNRYVLKRDISFVFERGMWRCKIRGVAIDDPYSTDFAAVAQRFMGAAWYNDAFKGANQQGIVTAMYTFMLTYTFWADRYPHFGTITTIQQVPEWHILQKFGDGPNAWLQVFSDRLLGK